MVDILAGMGLAANQSRFELEGGARLFTAELPDRQSASLVLAFGVGSRLESDEIAGASHFIEHLLFKGTRRRPSARLIAEAVEGVGGVMNAATDKELTTYWVRVPKEHLELAADVLFDITSDSQLAPEDVERERGVILEELKMYLDQPQDYVHSLFEETIWPDHPLGRDIIGTARSVSSLDRDQLRQYISQHYASSNLVIAAAGAIDVAAAKRSIASRLSLPVGGGPPEQTRPADPETPRVRLLNRKTEQAHIYLGACAMSYRDPDRHVVDLMNCVLGEGMSSRLFLEIRENRGLAYDVHSFTSKHRDTGYFATYMGVDPKKAEVAVEAAQLEMRRLSEDLVPLEELQKAKEYIKGRLRLGLEGTNSLANWLCQQELLMSEVKTVDEIIAIVDAISAEDVRRVAETVLTRPLQMAVIGPFGSDSRFRAQIGA